MKTNLKKLLSIALVAAFVLTMIPFAGLSVAAANASVSYADGAYEINAGTGGNTTIIENPVSIIPLGQTASVSFSTQWKYTNTTGTANFVSQDWHRVYFSNDPAFAASARIEVVRVNGAFQPHILGENTISSCVNFLSNGVNNWGALYTWTFNVVDGKVLLTVKHNTYGGQFTRDFSGVIQVGKPIYMKIEAPDLSAKYGETFEMHYKTNVNEADVNAAIAEVEALKNIEKAAADFDAKVAALPAADELAYCDKAAIAAVRAVYEALSDESKALVTKLADLEALEAAAETLVEDNLFRAADGKLYYASYNPEFLTVGSDVDGAVTTSTPTTPNTKDSALTVITMDKYPVLTTEYALQCYFGTYGNAELSLADSVDTILNNDVNQFKLIRTVNSSNVTTLYVVIDGVDTPCASFVATRTRLAYISVVKQNGSYYLNYDGHIVNGADYSSEVQEACKLENYFPNNFFDNNGLVHFSYGAGSMFDKSYFKVLTETDNNVIIYNKDTIDGDRNGITNIPAKITFRPEISVTPSVNENGNSVYKIKAKGGSAVIGTAIPEAGFSLKGVMASNTSHQYINYYISNDPTFKDSTELKISIIQYASSTWNHVIVNGKTVTTFYNLYNGATYNAAINSENMLTLTSGTTYNIADLSAFVGKPMYIKVECPTNGDLTLDVVYKDGGVAYNGIDTSALELAKQDAENLDYATLMGIVNDFTAENSVIYDADVLALVNEITTIAENKLKSAANLINEEVANIYSASTDWVLNAEAINTLEAEGNGNRYAKLAKIDEIKAYLNGLADATATELTNLKKGLLEAIEIDTSYDYYRDSKNTILDFIRMKSLVGKKS